jgi:hypothetical protein
MDHIQTALTGRLSGNGDFYKLKLAGSTLMIGLHAIHSNEFLHVCDIERTREGRFDVAWKLEGRKDQISTCESEEDALDLIRSAVSEIDLDG